jgi:hypothetical protein
MGISSYLSKFALGVTAEGLLSPSAGGTGTTTGGGGFPTVTSITYTGDDTATNTAGGGTVTVNGTNFATGITVLVGNTQVSEVTRVSATQITFLAPANAAGSYILYVINTDGSSAISVPGIQYSGVPAWTTIAGSLGSTSTSTSFSTTLAATGDAPISYLVVSGALPAGINLNTSTGVISGTTPSVASSTTYNFTIRATDAQNQDTNRAFSLTIAPITTIAIDYLIVGGGGGGNSRGGGGGGGGYRDGSTNMNVGQAYTITVGAGGASSTSEYYNTVAGQGSSSGISGIADAVGGGGGGLGQGGSGGSGGGGKGAYTTVGYGGSGSQGFSGGAGPSYGGNFNNYSASGGGGGAGGQGLQGGAGGPSSFQSGGNGGPGKTWLNGITYAPGGGGVGDPYYSGLNGVQGSGSGAGAGGTGNSSGGTGTVVIRYLATLPAASSVSGATTSISGGYRYYYWQDTQGGSITF